MSHWFHRNPLKSTTSQSFNLSLISAQKEAIHICEQLSQLRAKLIQLFCDPSSDEEVLEKQLMTYLSLLQGFTQSHQLDQRHGPTDSSKLRHYIRFKWTNSVLGSTPTVHQDSIFELISICYEYAIWLMKHSSQLATKDDITMDEAKQVHKCLRKAAGVITVLQKDWCDRLLDNKPEPGSDLDSRVMSAYIQQCQAEAQEVTIARAIELKHSSTLISALAYETSKMFLSSAAAIKALDQTKFGKWMTYFQLKSAFYESYAFCYLGDSLLEQEKCGESIRALEESEKFYETSVKLCKEYSKIKSKGTSAKIDEHLFFRRLRPLVTRIKDKCVRENGFIFHQKVAKDCPVLELKATHGLVTPEAFVIPPVHELWTPLSYSAFDLSKNIDPKDAANSKTAAAAEGPLPPVDEKPIKSSGTDPKNQSGCQIQ